MLSVIWYRSNFFSTADKEALLYHQHTNPVHTQHCLYPKAEQTATLWHLWLSWLGLQGWPNHSVCSTIEQEVGDTWWHMTYHIALWHLFDEAVITPQPAVVAAMVDICYVVSLGGLLSIMIHYPQQLVFLLHLGKLATALWWHELCNDNKTPTKIKHVWYGNWRQSCTKTKLLSWVIKNIMNISQTLLYTWKITFSDFQINRKVDFFHNLLQTSIFVIYESFQLKNEHIGQVLQKHLEQRNSD